MSTSAATSEQIVPSIKTAHAITDALAELPDSAIERLENQSVNTVFRLLFSHLLELTTGNGQLPGIEVFQLPDYDPANWYDPLQGTGYSRKDCPDYRDRLIIPSKQSITVVAIPYGLIPFGEDPAKTLKNFGLECADFAVLGNMIRSASSLNIRSAVRYVLAGLPFTNENFLYMNRRGNIPFVSHVNLETIKRQPKVNKALVILPLGS